MAEEFTEAVKGGAGGQGSPSQEVLCQQHSTRKLHAPLEVSTAKAAGACLGEPRTQEKPFFLQHPLLTELNILPGGKEDMFAGSRFITW